MREAFLVFDALASTAFFAGLMNAAQHIQEADAQLHKRQELMQKRPTAAALDSRNSATAAVLTVCVHEMAAALEWVVTSSGVGMH